MKRMDRRWKSLSTQQVQSLFDHSFPAKYATGGLAHGKYMPPFSKELIGLAFEFQFKDRRSCRYCFRELHKLTWTEKGEEHTEYYQGHMSEPGVYFVQHIIKGSTPPQCRTLVIDANTGLVTLCHARFGSRGEAREVTRKFYFGTIKGCTPAKLHHFTSDLVGKAIEWTYHTVMPPIKHIYSSEYYYTYTMTRGNQCWMASNPADFIKISDHLYIFSFLEERQTGTQGLFLINIDTLHDIGGFIGINSQNSFECYTVGAKGQWSTMETYFHNKNKNAGG